MFENINWNSLKKSILNNDCVLVLGPNTATLEWNGEQVSIQELLAEYLNKKLNSLNEKPSLLKNGTLPYIAKKLEDAYLPSNNYSKEEARARLGEDIKEFYQEYQHSNFPVFQKLASLPFRFVVNTGPDLFLPAAYDDENKFSATHEFYHYLDPAHNNSLLINEENIRSDSPLVYNLFGSIENPESMIMTEKDQLAFLDAILQKENKASIPANVAIQFTSTQGQQFEKTFVFIGFDFNQWHLRLLMHLISRYQNQKGSYALQDPRSISELTTFFYKRNFNVQFVDVHPASFAETLSIKLKEVIESEKTAPKLKVFLMFDKEDQLEKNKVVAQLAPLSRSDIISSWDEEQLVAGAERKEEIEKHLVESDIIILLVTANFFASDEIYENQLQKALERDQQKETVVIPILLESCLWESSSIGNLTTILPRNRRPLNEQENEEATLTDTIKQIEKICHKIFERKKKKDNS